MIAPFYCFTLSLSPSMLSQFARCASIDLVTTVLQFAFLPYPWVSAYWASLWGVPELAFIPSYNRVNLYCSLLIYLIPESPACLPSLWGVIAANQIVWCLYTSSRLQHGLIWTDISQIILSPRNNIYYKLIHRLKCCRGGVISIAKNFKQTYK